MHLKKKWNTFQSEIQEGFALCCQKRREIRVLDSDFVLQPFSTAAQTILESSGKKRQANFM